MIYINEQLLDNTSNLSTRAQMILSLIRGGATWLNWALADANIPAIRVQTEEELITNIQIGLHDTPELLFPSFRLHISKLFTLMDGDIEQLVTAMVMNIVAQPALLPMLDRNNLVTYAEMDESKTWLQMQNIGDHAVFQYPSFADMLALTTFTQKLSSSTQADLTPALEFGLQHASTLQEFIYYVQFYQYVTQQLLPDNLVASMQLSETNACYEKLQPLSPYLIYTISTGQVFSEQVIRSSIPQLVNASRFIGYKTPAAAILNLACNLNMENQTTGNLQNKTEQYMAQIKRIASQQSIPPGDMSQDGSLLTYNLSSQEGDLYLGVDETGNMFLLPQTQLNVKI